MKQSKKKPAGWRPAAWRALVEERAKLLRDRRTWQPAECRAILWADRRLRVIEKLFGQVAESPHLAPPTGRRHYLGCLGLLGECSVHVPDELREMIEEAFRDACQDGQLRYRRILNRLEIESALLADTLRTPTAGKAVKPKGK